MMMSVTDFDILEMESFGSKEHALLHMNLLKSWMKITLKKAYDVSLFYKFYSSFSFELNYVNYWV